MAPRAETPMQSVLTVAASILGPLTALALVLRIGPSWLLFFSSGLVGAACLFALYRTWRSPYVLRLLLRYSAYVTLFTALFTAFFAAKA